MKPVSIDILVLDSDNGTVGCWIINILVIDSDYGTVLCWGINKLGQQLQPCSFHLYPTGPEH